MSDLGTQVGLDQPTPQNSSGTMVGLREAEEVYPSVLTPMERASENGAVLEIPHGT
jgi:hypothetical protein